MVEDKKAETGDKAPDFVLQNAEEQEIRLSDLVGKWITLYFYPKDNTSGCTLEAVNFTNALDEFKKLGGIIIGISPDSCQSHRNFKAKHDLKVVLLSDPDKSIIKRYGVWALKKMYGKEYYGVERSTFLIDPDGKIAHAWRKVKVKGHVEEVKEKLRELVGKA